MNKKGIKYYLVYPERELKEDIDASSRVQILIIKAFGKKDKYN